MMRDINLVKTPDSYFFKRVSSKSDVIKDEPVDGYLIVSSESEARRIVDSLKGTKKLIAFQGGDAVLNRRVLESLKIDFLVSPEQGDKHDSLKQRDSGLNHVLAKIALRKNIAIVINLSDVKSLSGVVRARRLSRIMQNIVVCRKAGCKLKIASFASNKSGVIDATARASFGLSLGMSSVQSHDSTSFP